jgi:hypothetical protein
MNPALLAAMMQAYGQGMGGTGQPQAAGLGGPQLVPPQPRAGAVGQSSPLIPPAPPAAANGQSPLAGMNPSQIMQLLKMFKGGGGTTGAYGGAMNGPGGILGAFGVGNDVGLMSTGGGYAGLLGGTASTGAALGAGGSSFADLLAAGAIAM